MGEPDIRWQDAHKSGCALLADGQFCDCGAMDSAAVPPIPPVDQIEIPKMETNDVSEPSAEENARYAHRRIAEVETDVYAELEAFAARLRQQELTGLILGATVLCLSILVYHLSKEQGGE